MRINSVPDVKCFFKNKKCVTCTINGMTFRAPACIDHIFKPSLDARHKNMNPCDPY